MKFVLGLVSLLVAVAVVALVAKQQMHAVATTSAAVAPASSAAPSARQMEQQVGADVQKALEAGQSRNQAAERGAEGTDR